MSIDPNVEKKLKDLFSLPNWQERISPWKDIHDAVKELHDAWKRAIEESIREDHGTK